MNTIKPKTLEFLKDYIISRVKRGNDFHFDEGQALALAYLKSVVPDHRVPGQLAFEGLEPPEPITPNFEECEGVAFVGQTYDSGQLVIVHNWATLTALGFLREASRLLLTATLDEFEEMDDELRATLAAARAETGIELGEEPSLDEVVGPLGLPVGEVAFSDEYDTCHRCSTVIRVSADSRSWKADFYHNNDSELICGECVRSVETETAAYREYLKIHPEEQNSLGNLLREEER